MHSSPRPTWVVANATVYYLELAGEDDRFALAEADLACDDLELVAPGVAIAAAVDTVLADRLAQTRTVLEAVVQATGDLETLVDAVRTQGFDRAGTIAVRATSVRGQASIDAPIVERRVGAVLTDHGYAVDLDDPDHVFRILAAEDGQPTWVGGWVLVEPERSYGQRRPPNRPFKQPGTMRPRLARTLVNLSGVTAGQRLLDPMCGPGAILTEAALVGARPVGVDVQAKMVAGARENLAALAPAGPTPVLVRGSATALPIRSVDGAVFDAPYGRQSPIGFDSAPALVTATLRELHGLIDRCVAVFDAPLDDHATATGWTVVDRFDRRVHRSLIRYITVLETEN